MKFWEAFGDEMTKMAEDEKDTSAIASGPLQTSPGAVASNTPTSRDLPKPPMRSLPMAPSLKDKPFGKLTAAPQPPIVNRGLFGGMK
jgi:hypothetical protein